MRALLLDNYDSFTYNLFHYLEQFVTSVDVVRNDGISLDDVGEYDAIVLSPGPGLPSEAGIMPEVIRTYAHSKRVLGICLGHQAIGEAFGARLMNLGMVLHGVAVPIRVLDRDDPLFADLPAAFLTGRYHSWAIDPGSVPDCLQVTATDASGGVMALRHREWDVCGVQFHPESLLTDHGLGIIRNWAREA